MGTVATFDRSEKFFARTLAPMAPLLREGGYCGYINLNTIVNENGIWPLEFTCRFGYPGFAVLSPLQQTPWGDLFAAMASGKGGATMRPGFCVAIVLTTPPFPYDRKTVEEAVGLPIFFDAALSAQDQAASLLRRGRPGRRSTGYVRQVRLDHGCNRRCWGHRASAKKGLRACRPRHRPQCAIPPRYWQRADGPRLRPRRAA